MTAFFELCNEVRDAQTYSSSVNGNTDSAYMKEHFPNFIKAGSYSVNEVLDALKMPKKAQDILGAYWCYLGVDLDRMSFLHYGSMVIRYITRDAWMPKMRSHEISLAMDQRIPGAGGPYLVPFRGGEDPHRREQHHHRRPPHRRYRHRHPPRHR